MDAQELRQLACRPACKACDCWLASCQGWTAAAGFQWPDAGLRREGSLRQEGDHEPTFLEHHPQGTRYESPAAPIALRHYPANRADVYSCLRCHRAVLHHVEAGGYFVENRVRLVDPELVVDPPVAE